MSKPGEALAAPASPDRESFYSWYVVFVLILAYTLSFIDRTILTLLIDPIRQSLDISDVQVSLLHGFAFAIFYTLLGLPVGRLVDRHQRNTIIAVGVLVWSSMTALCGLSRNFGQMFLARIGVGVGEAALSPAAYSLLADWFPPARLTKALSVYTAAMYMGGGIAMVAGGSLIGAVAPATLPFLGPLEPWQLVFLVVGLPGIPVAMLVLSLREPVRRGIDMAKPDDVPSPAAIVSHVRGRGSAYAYLILGFSISAMMWNGALAWIPTFLIRSGGWSPAQVGLNFGLVLLVFGTGGIVSGGWLAQRMRQSGKTDANLQLGMISSLMALPLGVAAMLMPTAHAAVLMLCPFTFACSMPYGGAAAALQEITPNRMRGQVSALFLLGLNLFGIGLGPTIVALLTQELFKDDQQVGSSIMLLVLFTAPLSIFLLNKARAPYRAVMPANDA